MNIPSKQLIELAEKINQITNEIERHEKENWEILDEVCEVYRSSAKNLLNYGAFRGFDAREIQEKLKHLGLTRFANAEGNILGSLLNAKNVINNLSLNASEMSSHNSLSIGDGSILLKKHTDNLFGNNEEKRRVRIMVTQPTEAAYNYQMVLKMVQNGMDCARINCAHDEPEVWKEIIKNVKKAAMECGTTVKVAMDLAGPKIRTGKLAPGPRVKKFKPKRTVVGMMVSPTSIRFVPSLKKNLEPNELPVSKEWLEKLIVGDILSLKDMRGKSRKLEVVEIRKDRVQLNCNKTLYVGTGTKLHPRRFNLKEGMIREVPFVEQFIVLKIGDVLQITKKNEEGVLPKLDQNDNLIEPGKISCIPGTVISIVKEGEPILFDDGRIEGIIDKVYDDFFEVKIVKAKRNGSKLKAEKGINFPTLDIGISGLTAKDKTDLEFVAKYADIINYSYINSEADVKELLEEMERLKIKDKVSIILKIETRQAFRNLIGILLTAMSTKYLGVMIARGDLALEVGWKNMSMVQEEILSFCGAAHIPVVWATQVLESLAKNGFPSRSEITDTASSVRAECVMLNKGPYINEAIVLLDEILYDMERLHEKKEGMSPKIEWL